MRDTIEFARLASKRHRHYIGSIPSATSKREFQQIVRNAPEAEVAMLVIVRANWFFRSSILGLAQCRRTYCHHLVLEFLSVHPAIVSQLTPKVTGVGRGLVYSLAALARDLGIPLIWGEATAFSARFYSHILALPGIQDHFFIRGETLDRCQRDFREKFFGSLD